MRRRYYRTCGYANYTRQEAYMGWGVVIVILAIYFGVLILALT